MPMKLRLKTTCTKNKFVVELDLASVLAVADATNREYRQTNRKEPTLGCPQFRVTDPHKLFRFVVNSLHHPRRGTGVQPLPEYFENGIYHAIWTAAERRVGAVEEPDPDCPASVAEYSPRKKQKDTSHATG